jgi:hypothetical protein
MKITELLNEAYVDPEIDTILQKKGYKFLGKGVDQRVYAEPKTGLVLKIFGTSKGKSGSVSELTNAQKSFKTFYDAIQADPNNEFLPNIIGYAPFMFKGKPYLQIRMERLLPFKGPDVNQWNLTLADFADYADRGRFKNGKSFVTFLQGKVNTGRTNWSNDLKSIEQLAVLIGSEGLAKLYDTILMLKNIARKNRYVLDLHDGNFMLGNDGTPVISDPFFMGWGRST